MHKNDMTLEELKKELHHYLDDEGFLTPDSFADITGSFADIQIPPIEDSTGMVVVYIKNGMAYIPYDVNGIDFDFQIDNTNMLIKEMAQKIEMYLEYQKNQVKNMEFILEKQKLRRLF